MKKLFLLIFMLVNCIGLYAQQVMETSEAYKKADELLKKLTIEEKALIIPDDIRINRIFRSGLV